MSTSSVIISSLLAVFILSSTNSRAQNAKEAVQNQQQISAGKAALERDFNELQYAKNALASSPQQWIAIFQREIQQNISKTQQASREVRQSTAEVRSEQREVRQSRGRAVNANRRDKRDDQRDRQDDISDYQRRQQLVDEQQRLLLAYQATPATAIAEQFIGTMKRELRMTKVELGEDLRERSEDGRERRADRRGRGVR